MLYNVHSYNIQLLRRFLQTLNYIRQHETAHFSLKLLVIDSSVKTTHAHMPLDTRELEEFTYINNQMWLATSIEVVRVTSSCISDYIIIHNPDVSVAIVLTCCESWLIGREHALLIESLVPWTLREGGEELLSRRRSVRYTLQTVLSMS